ncbi:hypothetical protein A7U60_g5359 [Sanghuangporus baumii]|uniref:A to I editase domain-containing protein n=1 Tax=Sanghuangporus baumii TaxID=108892 RepID=A0A9Q5NBG3_SANBA|nr:hypothetical protein A7U60_g5359 [Sanghuangporus baumii]
MLSTDDVDALVTRVHDQFRACNFRPSTDYQYTVLATFVLQCSSARKYNEFKVVSLATGAKCLPTARYPPRGDTLHDSHAEVLARRAFVRWLYEESQRTMHASNGSQWIERCEEGKWKLKKDVKLHMYISTVPCGDASMRFLASSQDPVMAALKGSAPPVAPPPGAASRGRNNYSLVQNISEAGVIPSRAFNVLGIQGSLAGNIFQPIYLDSIIIGDVPEELRDLVREDCERAFYGRLAVLTGLPDSYRLAKPTLHFANINFIYSRSALQVFRPDNPPPSSSNESLCWTADSPNDNSQEVIINGIRRGIGAKQRGLEKYWPRLCKLQLYRLYEETSRILDLPTFVPGTTYHDAKQSNSHFQIARSALKGPAGPFAGWLVSGKKWDSFDVEGNILEAGSTIDPTPSPAKD